jgi:nitrate/nitrite transport system substrate-binding protein
MGNRRQAATTIGGPAYVNAPAEVIDGRLMGNYSLGGDLGAMSFADDTMLFHRGGETNFPRLAHGIWFMAQYVRFGRLRSAPDYEAIAREVILQDLYREVATEMEIPVPDDDMKPFEVLADGGYFDPTNPGAMIRGYAARIATLAGAA